MKYTYTHRSRHYLTKRRQGPSVEHFIAHCDRLRHSRINRAKGIHRQGLGHQPRKLRDAGPTVAREVLFDFGFWRPPGIPIEIGIGSRERISYIQS